ncbi:hypothetical protein LCGC14_1619500 [marine sediment metagenome]|uniref:Large polyvalent protein associated domain-containing protein n=1 Tax=marine sediment metagenome TaxID=412755 RepID=A0A0F9ISV1_9ZZZZ
MADNHLSRYEIEPSGLASAEFPTTLYDRPQLAISNLLLRQDLDAATRAIFSPQTLTPKELQTIRSEMLGPKPNKFAKTITDLATNPLVWIGLGLAVVYPIGTTKPMYDLITGASVIQKSMGPWMSQIHSAFTNLRNIPGLWRPLVKYWQETTRFTNTVGPKINEAFKAAGPLTKEQRFRVAAYMQGWNKAKNPLKSMIPELGKVLGDAPLAPKLQAKMSGQEIKLAGDLRKILDGTWKKFGPSLDKVRNELGAKGVKIGDFVEDYFPRFTAYSRYEKAGLKAAAAGPKGYQPMIDQLVGSKIASSLYKRRGLSLVNLEELKRMAAAGDIDERAIPAIESFINRRVSDTSAALRKAVINIREAGTLSSAEAQTRFVKEIEPHLGKLGVNLHARLGSQKAAKNTLHFMAESLLGTADDATRFGAELNAAARALALPAEYSMDVVKVMPRYVSALAPTYAWWAKGHGPAISKIIDKPGIFAGNRWQEEFTRGQLLPLMRGMKDWRSFSRATHFGDWKHRQYLWLSTSDIAKRFIPENTRNWLTKYFSDMRGSLSVESFGSQISRYFYISTLGFNIAPASKNLLQNYITLMNMPGIGAKVVAAAREISARLGFSGES